MSRKLLIVVLGALVALAMSSPAVFADTTVTMSNATEVRAIWSWFDTNGAYNYLEVSAFEGTPLAPGTGDSIVVLSWVRDFGGGPEVYATGFAQLATSDFKVSGKSLGSAKLRAVVPFDWGIAGSATLDLTWNGVGEFVIDDKTNTKYLDPFAGSRTITRDRFVGRFANVGGLVTLPEIGTSNVGAWAVDEYYPPYILYSASTSIQILK